jgi:hypothetical protein
MSELVRQAIRLLIYMTIAGIALIILTIATQT